MHIALWVLQSLLSLLCLAGGSFKTFKFGEVAQQLTAIPHVGWQALGVLEMTCGVLLVLPGVLVWAPLWTQAAASVLLIENIALTLIYAQKSTRLAPENPMLFSVAMALMAAFITYGRR